MLVYPQVHSVPDSWWSIGTWPWLQFTVIFKLHLMAEREWEWECFDVQGNRVEACGLDSCFFISFRQIISILIDFSYGKENGFAWNIFGGFELTFSAEEKKNSSRTGFCISIEPCMNFITESQTGRTLKSHKALFFKGECYQNCPPTQYRKDGFHNEVKR